MSNIFVSLNFFAEFFWHFHSFLLFYPTITVLLTRSKLWTKRRSCSTIVQVIHTAPQSMFIFIDLHADSNHYWCISGRIKAFAYAFYYWNFQYSFPMHYLTWNRLSCSFGNIEERRGQRKLYKTVHDTKLFEITTQKKKHPFFFFFFWFQWCHTITHPRKNLFKRDGEILQSINRLSPDKTLQISLVNPSFRLKILSRIFLFLSFLF